MYLYYYLEKQNMSSEDVKLSMARYIKITLGCLEK